MTDRRWNPGALAAVFVQFGKPVRAYRLMDGGAGTAAALAVTALVVLLAGAVPLLLLDWSGLEQEWMAGRTAELYGEGMSPSSADSVVAGELEEIRWRRNSIPFTGLLERAFYAVAGGLATFGAAYAAGIGGGILPHLKSAALSQGAYVLTALFLALVSMWLSLPADFAWSAAAVFDTGVTEPSRLYLFSYVFASHLDVPSAVSVSLWGAGLSALLGREGATGLRLTWFVYLCGMLLVSMPWLIGGNG
jgi:hypothetical protein